MNIDRAQLEVLNAILKTQTCILKELIQIKESLKSNEHKLINRPKPPVFPEGIIITEGKNPRKKKKA